MLSDDRQGGNDMRSTDFKCDSKKKSSGAAGTPREHIILELSGNILYIALHV